MLGNNMFAYCGNNSVRFSDDSGYRYVANCGPDNLGTNKGDWKDIVDDFIQSYQNAPKPNIAGSYGEYISLTLGVFNVSATLETATDLHGNIQLYSNISFDITTAASFSVSKGNTSSIFFVPDVTYLAGDAYYVGGSSTIPIIGLPIAVAGSANIAQTSDGYMGLVFSSGVAPAWAAGKEFHGGYSYAHAWTPAINVLDLIQYILH